MQSIEFFWLIFTILFIYFINFIKDNGKKLFLSVHLEKTTKKKKIICICKCASINIPYLHELILVLRQALMSEN